MEITYHGGNCVEISAKKEKIIIDGALSKLGLKDVTSKDAIYLATQSEFNPATDTAMSIDGPGEYEVRGVSIKGVASPTMMALDDEKNATIYRIVLAGVSIVVTGHVRAPLTEEELEKIGVVDIAIIPVGGNGYTMNANQATAVARQLEPKVVIPTHYADKAIKYEVPQDGLDDFIKEMSAEHEAVPSYKIKNAILPAQLSVMEITRS